MFIVHFGRGVCAPFKNDVAATRWANVVAQSCFERSATETVSNEDRIVPHYSGSFTFFLDLCCRTIEVFQRC